MLTDDRDAYDRPDDEPLPYVDDGLCGDCMDGKCHGAEDPDDCGCARHAASVEAANEEPF